MSDIRIDFNLSFERHESYKPVERVGDRDDLYEREVWWLAVIAKHDQGLGGESGGAAAAKGPTPFDALKNALKQVTLFGDPIIEVVS